MPRLILTITLLALAATVGCHRPPRAPAVGGSTSSKAEQARKQAEQMAASVAAGVANVQARSVPELARAVRAQPPGQFITISPKPPTPVPPTPPANLGGSSVSFSKPPAMLPLAPLLPEPSAPHSLPRPGSPTVIRERVSGSVCVKETEAEDDALTAAAGVIERKLAELDPPVRYRPTINEVRREFVRKDSRAVQPPSEDFKKALRHRDGNDKVIPDDMVDKLVSVEYDVEVTAEQVRDLRTRDRIAGALKLMGGLAFVALAAFLFLRLDEWTKGYLTHYLACAAVVAVGGAAAALYFA